MEEEKKETKKDNIQHKIKEQTEKKINDILIQGVQAGNIDMLYKLVDIHKDIANEQYWEIEKEGEQKEMRYRYGRDDYREDYGARRRDSRGRYMERGRDMKYRGHEMLDEMQEHYGNYSENRDTYGNKQGTIKSLEYMLESVVDFVEMLKEDATSQEEMQLIKKYTKEISEM